MGNKQTYSCAEIAEIAHVSRQAVDQWFRKRGKVKKRYSQADFDAYMSRERVSGRGKEERNNSDQEVSVEKQLIAQLQAQVRQLDKQLDKKDQEIDKLYTLLDQQQRLTLSSQQSSDLRQLDSKVDNEFGGDLQGKNDVKPVKKHGFWRRFWR